MEQRAVAQACVRSGSLSPVNASASASQSAAGPKRALTLLEVGYPSSKAAGSSERQQLAYFSALFGLLDTRWGDFGFVGVYGLADRTAADCEAEAQAFIGDGNPDLTQAWAAARCSMGLRAETDKLAWPELTAALSRFR